MIPTRDGRMRRLGIPALRDRVVQMALKLVIEPIFESGFASSYGSRPGRRAQDAIAEIVHFTGVHANYGVSSRFGGEPGPRSDGVRRPEDPWPASRPKANSAVPVTARLVVPGGSARASWLPFCCVKSLQMQGSATAEHDRPTAQRI
jgi:hypothetical protein